MKRVFFSCSSFSRDRRLRERLKVLLAPLVAQGALETFDESEVMPGAEIAATTGCALGAAQFIVLLLSPDYLQERADEIGLVVGLHDRGLAVGLTLLLRSCLYQHTPAAKLKMLNVADGGGALAGGDWRDRPVKPTRPIAETPDMDAALHNAVLALCAAMGTAPPVQPTIDLPASACPLSEESERAYLRCLIGRVGDIRSHWHEERLVPPSAHTKRRLRFRGLRDLFQRAQRTFHRHDPTDYVGNPGLSDFDLSVRAGLGRRVRIRNLLRELRRFERIVILGDPGSGKSVCLRHLVFDLAQRELKRHGRPRTIPILIEMGAYFGWLDDRKEKVQPILEYVAQKLRQDFGREIDQAPTSHPVATLLGALGQLLEQGRVTLVFDALDEMSQDGYQARFAALKAFMRTWQSRSPSNRFVYSCRSLDYDPAFEVDEVLIDAFDRGRVRRYLHQHLPRATARAIYQRIDGEESLYEIVSNPYFLHALTYINRGRFGSLCVPVTRGELMQLFVAHTLEREAQLKQQCELATAGGLELLIRLLQEIAMALQLRQEGGTSVATESLDNLWARYPTWRTLLRVARRARILGRRGEEPASVAEDAFPTDEPPREIDFVHHRLQEVFAARELARLLETGSDGVPMDEILGSVWWQETVILAIGMATDPGAILVRLLRPRSEVRDWLERVNG